MSYQNSPHSESGRSEQIISQFLLKSLHIILDSRIPSLRPHDHSGDLTSASRARKNDKWFHLALGDRPAALENLNFWHRNVMDPMIIDIILVHDSNSTHLYTPLGERTPTETVIERWVVQYETPRMLVPQPNEPPASYRKTYKKSIILLRSLYSTMRLLPAYKIFRQLSSSNQTYNFDIIYKVSSFGEPFSRSEEEVMKQYNFFPVEAHPGRLCVSVTYHPTLSDFNLELSTSLPPQIITDYVGSPATDPLKVFSSVEKEVSSTSFPLRGIHPTQFQRPHSWTSGLHRAAPFTQNYPLSASPPVYRTSSTPDYSPSPPDIYGNKIQSYRMSTHKKGTSFDEYQLSPPFSPSPSPSPPTNMSTANSLQSRLRSESAPVNIPLPTMGRNPRYLTPSYSEPNRHSLPPMSPRSTKPDISSQESPSGNRSFRKTDALRAAELYSGLSNLNLYAGQKMSKDSKDDSGRFSGLVSSSGSPRIGFSRSSSRLSFQDDLDDCDFSCPFAVDDVDTPPSQSRTNDGKESLDSTSHAFPSVRKSQDAAIGVLVQMLRTAPPLRQDNSSYLSQSSKTECGGEVGASSSFFMPRKTTDALEELRSYKDMKDLLLSQSGTQFVADA
ncbi:hypothetical protein AQUCO_03700333v1 [Aquilegia coerulea]|uniref:Autophagy-related protein 13 N-terminal domain-containing protein n=1 Tax=Aquilegia coerulea TaxID=218851 RepID=A0A2G5CUS1_AQUCA|nr:hypothetical protein AQUCO_03700333v1 [Aquilegia coerulea]